MSESVSASVFVFVFEGGQREGARFAASVGCRIRAPGRPDAAYYGFRGGFLAVVRVGLPFLARSDESRALSGPERRARLRGAGGGGGASVLATARPLLGASPPSGALTGR